MITPYDAEDCRGLLKAAIRDNNPVVFLESEVMYGKKFDVEDEVMDPDFVLPIGKAKVMREGSDVTLVAYARAVQTCLDAAEKLAAAGISCEVSLDVRSIRHSGKKEEKIKLLLQQLRCSPSQKASRSLARNVSFLPAGYQPEDNSTDGL